MHILICVDNLPDNNPTQNARFSYVKCTQICVNRAVEAATQEKNARMSQHNFYVMLYWSTKNQLSVLTWHDISFQLSIFTYILYAWNEINII